MSQMMIEGARLSFPSLFKKSAFGENEPKFSAVFMLDKKQHAKVIKQLLDLDDELATAKWGEKLPRKLFHALQDGDELDRPEYEGHYILKANNFSRPLVVDRDMSPLVEEDGRPMGGDYVNGRVRLYAWSKERQFDGVLCELQVVQFAKEGERFGDSAGAITLDGFNDLSEETAEDVEEEAEEFLA